MTDGGEIIRMICYFSVVLVAGIVIIAVMLGPPKGGIHK